MFPETIKPEKAPFIVSSSSPAFCTFVSVTVINCIPKGAFNIEVAPVLVLSKISEPVEQADEFKSIPPAPVTLPLSKRIKGVGAKFNVNGSDETASTPLVT